MPKWLIYAVAAVLFWGIWAFLSKILGAAVPAAQSQVISTIGLLPILLILGRGGITSAGKAKRGVIWAFLGGLVGGSGNVAFYKAMNLGGEASTVIPLTALYPVVTLVLALVLLRERITLAQWGGVALALAAIYLFNIGSENFSARWLPYALLPIALWGMAGLLQKLCTNYLSSALSTFWFLTGFVVISIVLLLTQSMSWGLPHRTWALGIALGLTLGIGNLGMIAAFAANGKASIITPLTGLYPFVSIPLAVYFLREKVSPRELAALALAVPAIIALSVEPRPSKQKPP